MDINTQTFIEQIKRRFTQFNIAYNIMESPLNKNASIDEMPFICDYMISIYLQNNALGHRDLYIYLNGENKELIAVETTGTTQSLLNTCKQLGMLYGIRFQRIEKVQGETDKYYFIFK